MYVPMYVFCMYVICLHTIIVSSIYLFTCLEALSGVQEVVYAFMHVLFNLKNVHGKYNKKFKPIEFNTKYHSYLLCKVNDCVSV